MKCLSPGQWLGQASSKDGGTAPGAHKIVSPWTAGTLKRDSAPHNGQCEMYISGLSSVWVSPSPPGSCSPPPALRFSRSL